jgi:hypothetical protein
MRKLQMLIPAWLCLCIPFYLSGQIYHETFSGQEGKGASGPMNTTDLSGVDWILDLSEANFKTAGNYIKVVQDNGEYLMEASHLGATVAWISPKINIKGHGTVKATVEILATEAGVSLTPQDFIRAFYILDDNPINLFAVKGNLENDIPGNVTMEQAGLEGKTLQIIIEIKNNQVGDTHRFDNVKVEAFSSPTNCPAINGDKVYISEFHYKGAGTKFIEITGVAGTDLSDYQLIFLNNGPDTSIFNLTGFIPDQIDGFGTVVFYEDAQGFSFESNGKGGLVLYNTLTSKVIYYISYGEENAEFDPQAPIIEGMVPIYAGKEQGHTTDGESIQINGVGFCPGDLLWGGPSPSSPGLLNQSQLLPIELIDFRARLQEDEVWLEWQTVTELNNDYMAVERSGEGKEFKEIGRVTGSGTTTGPRSYRLVDAAPLTGINYYRLRQVDFDGTATYHRVVSVNVPARQLTLQLFPTQARQQVTVRLLGDYDREGLLTVLDIHGRVLRSLPWPAGAVEREIPIQNLAPGTYFVQYQGRQELSGTTLRFVKQ